jgi:hypothetical protein
MPHTGHKRLPERPIIGPCGTNFGTPMRKVGQAWASLQAWVPWCASGTGLMRGMGRCTSEANDFRYSKRLAPFVKLATSYITQDMDD